MQKLLTNLLSDISIDKIGNFVYKDDSIIISKEEIRKEAIFKIKLMNFIYHHFYSKQNSKTFININDIELINDRSYEVELSKIQPHRKFKSHDWEIKKIISDRILQVSKNNITLTVDSNIHLANKKQETPRVIGEKVTIMFSCHFPNISNGFYVYKSQKDELNYESPIGRLYFNINPHTSLHFINLLLEIGYNNSLIFDFKVLKNLRNQYRIDSAVLYFRIFDYNDLEKILFPQILKKKFFNKEVSEFHFEIFTGVGFAEEPKSKNSLESYGTNRCHIIAETIFEVLKMNNFSNNNLDFTLQSFINKFDQYDINIDEIYKSKHSEFQPKKYKLK